MRIRVEADGVDFLGSKVPLPLPSSTLTLLSTALAATRSGLPSPFKSTTFDRIAAGFGGESRLRPEGAVAVAQPHGHVAGHIVGVDQVGDAVAGQVGHRHRARAGEARPWSVG